MQWNTVMTMVVGTAGAALATVLIWLAVKYRTWIATKVKNDRVEGVLARLGDFAFRVVGELNQTVVEKLKADGKWNKAEAEKVKAEALAKISGSGNSR